MSGSSNSLANRERSGSHYFATLLLSVCLLSLVGCSTDPVIVNPSQFEKLYVLGVLSPRSAQQEVYLTISRLNAAPKPVDNARVRISGPAGEVSLPYVADGIYRDLSGRLRVTPGSEYHLFVQMPDGREIFATTRIPNGFQILRPQPGDTIKAQRPNQYAIEFQLPIKWTIGTGWITQVTIHYHSEQQYEFPRGFMTAADSLILRESIYARNDTSINGGTLYLTQYDSAFSIHQLVHSSIYAPYLPWEAIAPLRSEYADDRINVNGAFGVFGSVVVDSVRFHLQVEKD